MADLEGAYVLLFRTLQATVNFSIPGYPDSILNSDITFH
jgi:hypothetical protein